MSHGCFIIPADVLERFAGDMRLSEEQRRSFRDTVRIDADRRYERTAAARAPMLAGAAPAPAPAVPAVTVFDCKNGTNLPGTPVAPPGDDETAQRVFTETAAVAEFYQTLFGRNSVDNAGMTLVSSIHFDVKYNNAYWNGTQMRYGDGDGEIFLNFTSSIDVIAHELTHGVTQFSADLSFRNEPGGLNESMSDVFGSMFRQWRKKQSVTDADWLIGKELMGPLANARGYACLRDLANPAAEHCLSRQPTHYSGYRRGMDPHYSSGIPNHAFYKAAMRIGGKSWEKAGKIWYRALTEELPTPEMKMKTFADRTRTVAREMFPRDNAVGAAVDEAWTAVGL